MKRKIIMLLTALVFLLLFLFLAFFNRDTGNNYMEELRQISAYDKNLTGTKEVEPESD